jgi:hypothetical protein
MDLRDACVRFSAQTRILFHWDETENGTAELGAFFFPIGVIQLAALPHAHKEPNRLNK